MFWIWGDTDANFRPPNLAEVLRDFLRGKRECVYEFDSGKAKKIHVNSKEIAFGNGLTRFPERRE